MIDDESATVSVSNAADHAAECTHELIKCPIILWLAEMSSAAAHTILKFVVHNQK